MHTKHMDVCSLRVPVQCTGRLKPSIVAGMSSFPGTSTVVCNQII